MKLHAKCNRNCCKFTVQQNIKAVPMKGRSLLKVRRVLRLTTTFLLCSQSPLVWNWPYPKLVGTDWNAICWYFASIRLCLALLSIISMLAGQQRARGWHQQHIQLPYLCKTQDFYYPSDQNETDVHSEKNKSDHKHQILQEWGQNSGLSFMFINLDVTLIPPGHGGYHLVLSLLISHVTPYELERSHWWKIHLSKKNPLQDLLSSLNAVISTNERS